MGKSLLLMNKPVITIFLPQYSGAPIDSFSHYTLADGHFRPIRKQPRSSDQCHSSRQNNFARC